MEFLVPGLGSGQLAGMNYHLLGVALGSLMLGTSAMLGVGFMWVYAWVWQGGNDWTVLSFKRLVFAIAHLRFSLTGANALSALFACQFVYLYFFLNGFFLTAAARNVGNRFIYHQFVTALFQRFADAPLWSGAFPVFFLMSWG